MEVLHVNIHVVYGQNKQKIEVRDINFEKRK